MESRQVVLKNLFVGKEWMRIWRIDFWTQCGEGESGNRQKQRQTGAKTDKDK